MMNEILIYPYKFVAEKVTTNLYIVHISKLKTVWFEHLHGSKTFEFEREAGWMETSKYGALDMPRPFDYHDFYQWCRDWLESKQEVKEDVQVGQRSAEAEVV